MTSAQVQAVLKRLGSSDEPRTIYLHTTCGVIETSTQSIESIEQDLFLVEDEKGPLNQDIQFIPADSILKVCVSGDQYEAPEWVCPMPESFRKRLRANRQ